MTIKDLLRVTSIGQTIMITDTDAHTLFRGFKK